jgi:hypothetical protein
LWYAAFGTAAPADSAVASPPGAGWTDVGGTQGGIMGEIDNTYMEQVVDQVPLPVGGRLTKQAITVTTQLAEATLANLQLAMNGLISVSVQSGYTTSDLQTATSATQPQYSTLIMDGWAPTTGTTEVSCRRRSIIWKVLSAGKATFAYEMDKNTVFNVTFTAYFVSSSVSPWHSIDVTT